MSRLPLGLAVIGAGASIASFVYELETNSPAWELNAINRGSEVLIVVALAGALAFERRSGRTASFLQLAAAATAVGFVIVALVKLHFANPHIDFSVDAPLEWIFEAGVVALAALAFGLMGLRVRAPWVGLAFVLALCLSAGCAVYAIYGERLPRVDVWWEAALAMAILAGSAAARMDRRWGHSAGPAFRNDA